MPPTRKAGFIWRSGGTPILLLDESGVSISFGMVLAPLFLGRSDHELRRGLGEINLPAERTDCASSPEA